MDGFAITLEGVDKPGAVRVKYQIPGTGKLFNAGEIDVKNETISIPVTMAFISYAKENKEKVVSISKDLNNHGILTWFDDDMILPGDNWQLKIKQAIEKADYFLPFLSCQYNNRELHLAMHQQSWGPEDKRFIIPILLDDCDAPYNLKKFSAAKTSDQNWFKKLLKAIAPSHIKHTL